MLKKHYLYAVLDFFKGENVSVSKILLQKAVYALDFSKEKMGLTFEGYIYGPFCREISDIVSEMEYDDLVSVEKREIVLDKNAVLPDIPQDVQKRIHEILSCFYESVLQRKPSFEKAELYGTVMYVMDVLDLKGNSVDGCPAFDSVLESVRLWKRNKFSEDQVREPYDRILGSIWEIRAKAA